MVLLVILVYEEPKDRKVNEVQLEHAAVQEGLVHKVHLVQRETQVHLVTLEPTDLACSHLPSLTRVLNKLCSIVPCSKFSKRTLMAEEKSGKKFGGFINH